MMKEPESFFEYLVFPLLQVSLDEHWVSYTNARSSHK